MADIVPEDALVNLLQRALDAEGTIEVRLFKNLVVPSSTIGLAQLQEATFSGYGEMSLVPAVEPSATEDNLALAQGIDALFAHKGGSDSCNVYGYFLTQGSGPDMKLILFNVDEDGPTPMASLGDFYEFRVTVLATQEA